MISSTPSSNDHVKEKTCRPVCSMGPSPFPTLDSFVNNELGKRKGLNGSIRSWRMESQSDLAKATIIYNMKGNRWCDHIGRSHKSNNIMWVVSTMYELQLDIIEYPLHRYLILIMFMYTLLQVSIPRMQYYQDCYDPECRLNSFERKTYTLPKELQYRIGDSILEKSLEIDEEFERELAKVKMP